jgi:hypothetical protein
MTRMYGSSVSSSSSGQPSPPSCLLLDEALFGPSGAHGHYRTQTTALRRENQGVDSAESPQVLPSAVFRAAAEAPLEPKSLLGRFILRHLAPIPHDAEEGKPHRALFMRCRRVLPFACLDLPTACFPPPQGTRTFRDLGSCEEWVSLGSRQTASTPSRPRSAPNPDIPGKEGRGAERVSRQDEGGIGPVVFSEAVGRLVPLGNSVAFACFSQIWRLALDRRLIRRFRCSTATRSGSDSDGRRRTEPSPSICTSLLLR